MGRPKKDAKDLKSKMCSFRLKEAEYLFLVGKFGTIQKAVESMTQKEISSYKRLIEKMIKKY